MEKLLRYFFLLLLIATGCANDEPNPSPCGEDCEIVEEYSNVTARVVQWPFTCDFVLTTDSVDLNTESANILIPCDDLPEEFRINDTLETVSAYQFTLVTISGYKYNCCYDFTPNAHPSFKGFGCKFEITAIELSPLQLPIKPPIPCDENCQVLDELIQVKAKVFRWGPSCDFFLTTDSVSLVEPGYIIGSNNILVPCEDIPFEFSIEESLVTVSGYKYNCCEELVHHIVKTSTGFGCKFEITAIEPIN